MTSSDPTIAYFQYLAGDWYLIPSGRRIGSVIITIENVGTNYRGYYEVVILPNAELDNGAYKRTRCHSDNRIGCRHGKLYTWGRNNNGQLGAGISAQYTNLPKAVDLSASGLDAEVGQIMDIAAGEYHYCNDNGHRNP